MAKAYVQALQNRDGDDIYPVTTSDAVYLQKTDSSGVITQQTLTKKLESMETSFQDGVDTIVAALTELGVTPESTTPAGITAAIKTMYSEQYETGIKMGHAQVIADPGAYGLITQDEYDTYGKEQYQAGIDYADGRVNEESASYTSGYSAGKLGATASYSNTKVCSGSAEFSDSSISAWVKTSGYAGIDAKLENGVLTLTVNGYSQGEIATENSGNRYATKSYSKTVTVNVA